MQRMSILLLALVVPAAAASAQDPAKVDPTHYKVEYKDDRVRVLRISFGPHEKSVMHEHPTASCLVRLTDEHTRHVAPDGKATESQGKAGTVECNDHPGRDVHNPENLSDSRLEMILIERNGIGAKRP